MITPFVHRLTRFVFGASALCLALVVLLVVEGDRKQADKDAAYQAQLRPAIAFVDGFAAKNHRLPTETEFEKRPKADDSVELVTKGSSDPAFGANGGRTNFNYCVRIWRGER